MLPNYKQGATLPFSLEAQFFSFRGTFSQSGMIYSVIGCWKEVENATVSAPLKLLQFCILLKSNWWDFFFHLLLNIGTDLLLSCQNVNWSDRGLQEIFTGSAVILCACATVLGWRYPAYSKCIKLSEFCFHLQVMQFLPINLQTGPWPATPPFTEN